MTRHDYTSDDYISAAGRLRRRGMKSSRRYVKDDISLNLPYDRIAESSKQLNTDLSDMTRANYAYSFGFGSQLALDVLATNDPKLTGMYETLNDLFFDLKAQAAAISEYADQKTRE